MKGKVRKLVILMLVAAALAIHPAAPTTFGIQDRSPEQLAPSGGGSIA